MSNSLRIATLLSALATVASAQTPCHARARELAFPSPRTQLAWVRSAAPGVSDVMADGAVCDTTALSPTERHHPLRLAAPTVRVSYLGGVPDTRTGEGQWTGVGLNAFARIGLAFDRGFFHVTLAPEIWVAQNERFNFFADTATGRSPFSSNWYLPPYSIDLPSRFGAAAVTGANLGQSAAWIGTHDVEFGVSSSSQAWGPGVRGHLLLSANAAGIPRLFVRTQQPINTWIGSWSGTAFVGTLTESPFFDSNPSNNLRTMRGFNLAWSPDSTGGFVVGLAHASMRTGSLYSHGARKLRGPSDQMNSVYARVQAPSDGLRAWAEVARADTLASLRQFVRVPYQGLSYLVGISQAVQLHSSSLLLSAEVADLEQYTDIRGTPTQDFYTSSDIPQGWTQRGVLLGDGIGPGGNSQYVALDWIGPVRSAGFFVERVRWNEDAFLRQYLPYLNRHDVTIRAGVRGGTIYHDQEVNVELSAGKRMNYLFQNGDYLPGINTVDVTLTELRFSIVPFAGRSR
ncbi:MAG TPA: capsule assembly Wzi family protein [Gemmatimonadaceae bacterium]|nr:capsule assembly Wzi family protein [Gemmatimonadaceae bacterium]